VIISDMENSVDLVSMTVGILTWIPCKFYCGYYEYPENSAVGILTTLPFLRCGYFDRGYFEWYPFDMLWIWRSWL